MHILLVPSWYPSTASPINGVFFREQALALKRAGHKVGVIAPALYSLKTLFEGPIKSRCNPSMEDDNGIQTYRHCGWRWFPLVGRANAELWVRAGVQLYKQYVQHHGQPDVIHAHAALYGGVLAARLKKELGVPTVLTEHFTGFARGIVKTYQHRLAKTAFASANYRIAVSPQFGELLESIYGHDFRPWNYVPNLLDHLFVDDPLDVSERLPRDSFRFFNVALLSEKKGHRDLLEAFSRAFQGDSKIRLTIGGDGDIKQSLIELARDLGIGEQVDFLGILDRGSVRVEMLRSNAFVLPSHYETFGVVAIEALSCGLPVIATRCGGPESIVTKEDGVLVPTQDPEMLAAAMVDMRDNASGFDRGKIRQRCISRFGESRIINQLESVYAAVTSKMPNPHKH